ncbi:MAG: ribosome recycling factor [Deltaproteobacteria bacterium]|nr:ribosome recycling factor [Deltaproteobacteria bacterium]
MNKVTSELNQSCDKTIEAFKKDLSRMRTGRASSSLLENISVDYYGSQTPLKQLGTISVPEPRTIAIQVFDASSTESIEKAIMQADLGLNPSRDGNLIRVNIPALTEERRKELIKKLKEVAEESRISIRNHRRDAIDKIKKLQKDKELSEDDSRREQENVQTVTDSYIKKIDKMLSEKEHEMLEV